MTPGERAQASLAAAEANDAKVLHAEKLGRARNPAIFLQAWTHTETTPARLKTERKERNGDIVEF